VRIDCIIQDIFDREMECLPTNGAKCPLYSLEHHSPSCHRREDTQYIDLDILYTVPVPPTTHSSPNDQDTPMEDVSPTTSTTNQHTQHLQETSHDQPSQRKRKRLHHSNSSPPQKKLDVRDAENLHSTSLSNTSTTTTTTTHPFVAKSPDGMPCIIKVYHGSSLDDSNDESSSFRLTSILTVIGILTQEPTYFPHPHDEKHSLFHQEELSTRLPSTSLVPRLYALHMIPHASMYAMQREQVRRHPPSTNNPVEPLALAQYLVKYLAQGLGSDTLAGRYLVIHLLSRTHRTRELSVINKLTLNLCGLTHAEPLLSLLRQITPVLVDVLCDTDTLNAGPLYPRKNHEKNKLELSPLQLPAGTHLVLNEIPLTEGHVNEQALKNINVVKQLISQQTLSYDYEFDSYSLPVDIPTLVVSRRKSLVHDSVDVVLPVQAKHQQTEDIDFAPLIPHFRTLLMSREKGLLNFPQLCKDVAQQDFVRLRQTQSPPLINQVDLARFINMARLLALSYQCTEVNERVWKEVLSMEKERRQRLSARK